MLVSGGAASASATDAAGGATSPAASAAESALQVQAQELAGQIQSEGQNLDQLAEAFDAAQIRSQRLGAQLTDLHRRMTRTNAQVAAARAELKEQALLAYLAGGAPLITYFPDRPGSDPSLTVSYAQIVSQGQERAVHTYRAILAVQTRQSSALAKARGEVNRTLSELKADRAAAQAAVTQREQTLADVKGKLAVLVSSVQKAQQQAEQAAVKTSLAQRGDLPPSQPALTAAPVPPSTARRAPAVPVSAAPTTRRRAPSTTSPRTTPPTTSPPVTSPPTTVPKPPPSGNNPTPGWSTAVHYAYAQLGKPYQFGGAGPKSFDCSGLTMMAWASAGWSLPHWAQGQYDMTEHIPLSYVLPGDLIFFGTPNNVGHVGIYIGGGEMIDAPTTGLDVSVSSIYWSDLLGAGRLVR
jgi:cell wall-associated NlpC family hydrolase